MIFALINENWTDDISSFDVVHQRCKGITYINEDEKRQVIVSCDAPMQISVNGNWITDFFGCVKTGKLYLDIGDTYEVVTNGNILEWLECSDMSVMFHCKGDLVHFNKMR